MPEGACPLIVAHRGASHDAPENTLAAFEEAWRQGADAIEGDFRLTRDGEVVCVHDPDLMRVAGVDRQVAGCTLAELRAVDVGRPHPGSSGPARIPTLAEVLDIVPDGRQLFLEIKSGLEILPALCRGLATGGLDAAQVVFISFEATVLAALRGHLPGCRSYWLRHFSPSREGREAVAVDATLQVLRQAGAVGLSTNPAIPGSLREALPAEAFSWHVWTVDDGPGARRAREMGAASITTNCPGTIRAALA